MSLLLPLSSVDPGEVEQDVQHWSLEEAAAVVEEHGSSQSHAGPAAGVLRPGETGYRPKKSFMSLVYD